MAVRDDLMGVRQPPGSSFKFGGLMADFMSRWEAIEQGDWAGWKAWIGEPFEDLVGPFYYRVDALGPVCALRAEGRHLNGYATMHGGCLASFADAAIFSLSEQMWIDCGGVTVNLSLQYMGAVREGDLLEARARSVRAAGEFVFVSAMAHVGDQPVLGINGTIKISRRS